MSRRTISVLCLPVAIAGFALKQHQLFDSGRRPNEAATARNQSPLLLGATPRPLTNAERERRDEERRRQVRKNDVVIGKTSAKSGETDFTLDIAATEEEWMRQASRVEQEVYRKTEQGMHHLKLLQVEEASHAFDQVFELKPSAYLWQAGIAKFYLNQMEDAADVLVKSATRFEKRFFEPATEERIWRDACELKLLSSIATKQERKRVVEQDLLSKNVAQVHDTENTAELLASESRKVLRIARELFNSTLHKDYSTSILSRAKLRSICGPYDEFPVLDRKLWKLTAWFYLGLHYDAMGNEEESKKCMKMALRLSTAGTSAVDIVHTLPMLHMARRDWFDDDEDFDSDLFESDDISDEDDDNNNDDKLPKAKTTKSPKRSTKVELPKELVDANPIVVDAIREGIDHLSILELREALSMRGLKIVGSKDMLQTRLFDSLMTDAGLIA